jgi:hypothetical protein
MHKWDPTPPDTAEDMSRSAKTTNRKFFLLHPVPIK